MLKEQKVGGKTNMEKVIIFDGDDTLWKTQELYDNTKAQFKELMVSEGFNEDVVVILDNIDAERVKILKFSKSRFLESMLITYAILIGKYQKSWNIEIERKIRDYAQSVFKFPPILYDDTIDVLKELSQKFILVLFTSGDKEIQEEKINSLGKAFLSFFSKIYITEIKTEEEYKKIIDDLDVSKENIYVVGNSVKSDINPALKLGLKAILLQRKTWKYEEDKLFSDKVLIASSLTNVKNLILEELQ
mgnify:CR=1 FL=1